MKTLSILALLLTSCAHVDKAETSFNQLYDYYFPKNSEYLQGRYREWFDRVIFSETPPPGISENEKKMRSAVRGEIGGFHAFANSPFRDFDGEFGETWFFQCQLLLIVLGDEKFSRLLAKEDLETQNYVSRGLVGNIDWSKNSFPKTYSIVRACSHRSQNDTTPK